MIKQNYTPHILALSSIFILENSVKLTSISNFIALLIWCILSLTIIFAMGFLLKLGQKNKVVYLITTLLLCVLALYVAATTFLDYANYLIIEQMPRESKLLITLFLLAIVAFLLSVKNQAIYKYCLLTFAIIVVIMIVCFVAGSANFNYKNISINFSNFSVSPNQFIKSILPVAVLPLFNGENKKQIKTIGYGIVVGFVCCFIAVLQTILTLGNNYETAFPYLKAVSTISSGSLFTRIDGAIWFVFFVCSIIKITVCVKSVFIVIKNNTK